MEYIVQCNRFPIVLKKKKSILYNFFNCKHLYKKLIKNLLLRLLYYKWSNWYKLLCDFLDRKSYYCSITGPIELFRYKRYLKTALLNTKVSQSHFSGANGSIKIIFIVFGHFCHCKLVDDYDVDDVDDDL